MEKEKEFSQKKEKLREIISESLRVQRGNEKIEYIDSGTALADAKFKQNHAIFARRGCGKTLLLHHSARQLSDDVKSIYLNCEDFKRHTFPNVLIEILTSLFREMRKNQKGWFGRKRKLKSILDDSINKLEGMKIRDDTERQEIKATTKSESSYEGDLGVEHSGLKLGTNASQGYSSEIERSFAIHRDKLRSLDEWLPTLKENIREFFSLSNTVKYIIIQLDDLYHLKRMDQAFIVDYIHRLCKDVPLYFKLATLRHASTLYIDRDGQPIGAQERHDYQPIDIDYTFKDFNRTLEQNKNILLKYADKASISDDVIATLFKGEGFSRLVMAGGGVPRDVLSLFLELLSDSNTNKNKIGKDDVRNLSKQNFERKIDELKQDSKKEEQGKLLKGIYMLKTFCLDKKTNIFLISEKFLQENDSWRELIYRLLDYRIIHNTASAITHKTKPGTYQAFSIDIGCYAHFRQLNGRFNEIDLSSNDVKDKMRSSPILDEKSLENLRSLVPQNSEQELKNSGE
ncbi:hypothetical protein JCM25156A_23750 [Komagataeibacter kakiaceti JCM 25156]|uniref:hypothetical protein n=1 Tax=Komagataeibacter kakiaceti TaxID=943261 RepID=UPI000A00BCD6|nr:hypothetical protein [Komagataeibacter kakiaceti]